MEAAVLLPHQCPLVARDLVDVHGDLDHALVEYPDDFQELVNVRWSNAFISRFS